MSSTRIGGASLSEIRAGQSIASLDQQVAIRLAQRLGIRLTAHRNATFFNAKGRITSGVFVAQSFPNETSLEMLYRPVPEQNLAE
jgi:hypothetical protein